MSEAISATRPRVFYGYPLAVYCFVMGFAASSFFLHSRGIFFPLWMEDFSVDKTQVSLAISLTLFTGSCCAPLTGFCLDRYPVRGIITLASMWLAIGYLLLRFVDGYAAFLAVLVVFQGLGWTGVGPLAQTKLMVNWFSRNRGVALGIAIMGISVAGIMMPTVATLFAERLGWRDSYTVYALFILLAVVPATWFLVKQEPAVLGQFPDGDPAPVEPVQTEAGKRDTAGLKATYWEFLSSKAFWSIVITFGLMNGVYSAMITHLPTYLTTELQYDLYDASYLLGIAGGFAIAGKVVLGWMMDHFNAKATVMSAIVAYFTSTLIFMNVDSYPMLMLGAGLFGLGFGGMVPVRSVLLSRLFGIRKFSRANGLLSFFLAPATFWVLITGYVADTSGSYVTAFQIWACAFALAGLVSAVVRLPNQADTVA
jgi:MFS family permease